MQNNTPKEGNLPRSPSVLALEREPSSYSVALSHLASGNSERENLGSAKLGPTDALSVRNTFITIDNGYGRSFVRSRSLPMTPNSSGVTQTNTVVRLPDLEGLQSDFDLDDEEANEDEENFTTPTNSKLPRDLTKLTNCSDEELKKSVPKNKNGEYLSIGSQYHDNGTCRPCVFYNVSRTCKNGIRCYFCHHIHAPKRRVRLCKKKRAMLKKMKEQQVEIPETTAVDTSRKSKHRKVPCLCCTEVLDDSLLTPSQSTEIKTTRPPATE